MTNRTKIPSAEYDAIGSSSEKKEKGDVVLKDFMDYCDMQLQSETTAGSGCAPVTQPCVYNGVSKLPENPVTTMAYVPFQTDTSMYEAEKALCRGTVFPDLDKPFLGGRCI